MDLFQDDLFQDGICDTRDTGVYIYFNEILNMHDSVNLIGYTQVNGFRGIFNVEENFCFDFDKGQRNSMYLKKLYGNMF